MGYIAVAMPFLKAIIRMNVHDIVIALVDIPSFGIMNNRAESTF